MKKLKYMLPLCGLIILIGSCGRQHVSYIDISPAPLIRSVSTGFGDKAAKALGWDEAIWDLSGDEPKLK